MSSSLLAREWAKSQQSIAAYIASLVSNFTEAEELLQETAMQVFQNADRYDSQRPFLPWALGIARNVVRHYRRQQSSRRKLFEDVVIEELAKEFEELAGHREDLCRSLVSCQKELPDHHQYLCSLRYEQDLSPQEIASRLNVTSGQVRMSLQRIREQLGKCVERKARLEGVRI